MPLEDDEILFTHRVKQVINSKEQLNSLCATIESEIKSAINPIDERIRDLEKDNAVLTQVAKYVIPAILGVLGTMAWFILSGNK